MSNKTYDIIKNTALFAVPVLAFASAVVTILAQHHENIPAAEITAIITALDTLLGGIVLVAKKIYDEKKNGGGAE
jgi:energy-converting hydrogenase Eha subunit A